MTFAPAPVVSALVLASLAALQRARRRQAGADVAARLAPAPARGGGPGIGPAPSPLPLPAPPSWLAADLADMGVDLPAAAVWSGLLAAPFVAAAAGAIIGGPGAAAVGLVAVPAGAACLRRLWRGRGDARVEAALPGALDAVARSLRSGASLRQAIGEAGESTPAPLGDDLRDIARAAAHGVALVDGLEGWAGARPLAGVRLASAALCLGSETGGAQARAVDGVAATIRDQLAVAGELRALSSQARISAVVITLAPLAFCALSSTVDPRTTTFLFRTPVGLAFLATGLALDALAALWMARLTRPS